ncbi:MAG: winged helix-turn-helix domain-containing protein [Acidobacteria bacterium]|nr:winged helix-turn-helix domain-containing protein [Acidobacteriota bacterium]
MMERAGEPLTVTPKVFELLLLLLENAGHVLEKEQLLARLWPDAVVEEANLTRNISRLRKVLDEEAAGTRYIETVPKLGYRFVGEVRVQAQTRHALLQHAEGVALPNDGELLVERVTLAQTVTEEEILTPTAEPSPVAAQQLAVAPTGPKQMWWLGVLGVFLAAAVGLWYWQMQRRTPTLDSLAVLPFANVNGEAANDYLAEGLTETLINNLAQIRSLRVAPRSLSFKYKGPQADLFEAGRALGSQAVLTGRIRRVGELLNIQAELVDVAQRAQLWGTQYERPAAELQSIQREMVKAVVGRLRGPQAALGTATYETTPAAYEAYLKGTHVLKQLPTLDAIINEAIAFFDQAIALDPNYAPAYAGLARASSQLMNLPSATRAERTKAAALRALAFDDNLPYAHLALAELYHRYDWQPAEAEREFKRAIELAPDEPDLYENYVLFLLQHGRFTEAQTLLARQLQLEPVSKRAERLQATMYWRARQYDQLLTHTQSMLERFGSDGGWRYYLAQAYLGKKQYEPALELLRQNAQSKQTVPLLNLSAAYAQAGRRAEALNELAHALASARGAYVCPHCQARTFALLGEADQTFALLEKSAANRDIDLVNLKTEPAFELVCDDPRFQALLRRLGL